MVSKHDNRETIWKRYIISDTMIQGHFPKTTLCHSIQDWNDTNTHRKDNSIGKALVYHIQEHPPLLSLPFNLLISTGET